MRPFKGKGGVGTGKDLSGEKGVAAFPILCLEPFKCDVSKLAAEQDNNTPRTPGSGTPFPYRLQAQNTVNDMVQNPPPPIEYYNRMEQTRGSALNVENLAPGLQQG